jgi:hypothetical protein
MYAAFSKTRLATPEIDGRGGLCDNPPHFLQCKALPGDPGSFGFSVSATSGETKKIPY